MSKHLALRPLLLFALVLIAGACASTRNGDRNADAVSIVVENTVVPASDLTVYVVSQAGTRQLVGSVPPGQTATLRYRGPITGGQYRLFARPTGGREFFSNSFNFTGPGTTIRWNITSNIAVPVD